MSDSKFKAYVVSSKTSDDNESLIIFAETSGKAKVIAQSTSVCSDTDFIDIECHREPCFDKYYKTGKIMMYWNDDKDRIVLCKEGWACVGECNPDKCSAKKYCHRYDEEYLEEI